MNKYTFFLGLLLCSTIQSTAIAMSTSLEEKTPQQAHTDLFNYVRLSGNPFESFGSIKPILKKFNDNPEFDINKKNILSETLLGAATVHAILERLTQHDECCDCDQNNNKIFCPYVKIIKYLLKFGANPNIPGSRGLTPLQIVIKYSHLNNAKPAHIRNIIKLLLQHGADASSINWHTVPREIINHESMLPFLPANTQTLSTEACLLF